MPSVDELVDHRIPGSVRGSTRVDAYPEGSGRSDEDQRAYARYTRALWDEQTEALRPLHQIWTENLLFLVNKQWYVNRNGEFVLPPVPDYRERPVINLCLPFFRTFLSKVLKTRPAWQVNPASSDPEDVQAASLGEDVLKAKWIELGLARRLREAVSWAVITGNGYLYPFWNTATGKLRELTVDVEVPKYAKTLGIRMKVGTEVVSCPCDEDGEPKLGKDGRPIPGAQPHVVDEGEVGVKSLSPFQVRVNPEATSDDEVTWVTIGDPMTLRAVQRSWPKAFKGDGPHPRAEDESQLKDYASSLAGVLGGDLRTASPRDERAKELDKVLVLFHHEKPSDDYPGGRYWVTCNEDVVLEPPTELPDQVWPPVHHIVDVVIPGRYHAAASMEAVVPLNREYNELCGQIKEHHNLFIRGKWLVPQGSGIRKGRITTEPGEVVKYNPGFKPEQMDLKPLPSAVYDERSRVLDDYQLVGGIHQVSQGRPPPGVTAGVAFLQLQEADDTDFGPFLAMLEEVVARLANDVLQIVKLRYTDDRLIRISGPGRKFQVRSFTAADLEGAVDVVPVAESSFPWSKTARQSMVISLAQQMPQLFVDPDTKELDKAAFARMLPIGGLEAFADQEDIDVQEALNEEDLFSQYVPGGQLPEIGWWQNHEAHTNQHVRILKAGTHRKWAPAAQQAFLQHVQQQMAARDQKRAEKNIANGGTPPGGQVPPGPGAPPDQLMQQQGEGPADMVDALPGLEVPGAGGAPASGEQEEMIQELAALQQMQQPA